MREGSAHSLAFRVMRLCRPALQVELPLRVDPVDLRFGEDDPQSARELDSEGEGGFAWRTELERPIDALGLTGMMVLPQTFGSIYLGETFCSYISVGNHSDHDVRDVGIKAELQTERHRITLADNTKTPLEGLKANGRYDFLIEHDIKELGQHTLVCTATYLDNDGERKLLPQYFKFQASNPLSVRTKVRTVKDNTFLEACIENSTKSPLFLETVRFEPSAAWTVEVAEAEGGSEDDPEAGPLRTLIRRLKLVRAGGGAHHFLYHLRRRPPTAPPRATTGATSPPPAPAKLEGGNTLGKLEILWRTTLGEPGRLQTQQILGNPLPRKDVELRVVEHPSGVLLERPFQLRCRVSNSSERMIGPLKVTFSGDDAGGVGSSIAVCGHWNPAVPALEPHSSLEFDLSFVALASGVQKVAGLAVVDATEGFTHDTLPPLEIFVEHG